MKGNAKECSNYCIIALTSYVRKVMPQILQAGLQQYVNCELPDVQKDLEKAEEPEIKLSAFIGPLRKQGSSRKTATFASLTTLKTLTVWITTNCGKFLKRWEHLTILLIS